LATAPELLARLDAIDARYRGRFAGHPRISRDPEELEAIQADVEAISKDASSVSDAALTERIEASRKLYAEELVRIQEARAGGPAAVAAHRVSTMATLVMGRYGRFFAAKNRTTVDVGLLESLTESMAGLVAEMERLEAQGANVAEDLERMRGALKVYRDEQGAIRSARGDGTVADQAQRLATLANGQFDRYRLLFAGEPRMSRDPEVLAGMIKAIREIHGSMRALQTRGVTNDAHLKNMQIVSDRIDSWEQELATIRDVITRGDRTERIGRLGEAANKIFAEYREHFAGKDRKTRDLTKLANLIEQLWPIQRCMDAIDADDGDDTNARNLSIVTDQLRVYDREYRNIQQAQQA
jgi:hypothetical protein